MKLKSYFSATVEAAMEQARKELGDDALLVNARPATPETRYLGAYEVVFGLLPPEAQVPPVPTIAADPIRSEIAELRRQIDRLTMAPADQVFPPSPPAPRPSTPLPDARVDATLGHAVALVGPPGCGKTTTLIKLAVRYGLAGGKATQIISTDVVRIAAADQLRALSAILGIRCEIAETPVLLESLLREASLKDLVLIDTPGFSFREMEEASELAASLSGVETHLLLPASMNAADLSRVADSYAIFSPSKLLFTRIDETARHEVLLTEAERLDLPVSFLCTGQRIPDDLEEATVARLHGLVEAERPLRMGAAA